jgi:ABC-type lipoprotein export system ATPase subunit
MPLVALHELRKCYTTPDGERHTVVDIQSFDLEAGNQVALRGSSGSGKTTLLNMIAGILAPDAGSITVDGVELSGLPEAARDKHRARTIGYVFQTFNLLQGFSALENVLLGMAFGPGAKESVARELLERVGLGPRMRYKPRQLSVGQQQRVAVARALANHPKLVLADEPTGNLDARNAQESLALMRELCRENGAALLLVSHDQQVLSQFEDVRDLAAINKAAAP